MSPFAYGGPSCNTNKGRPFVCSCTFRKYSFQPIFLHCRLTFCKFPRIGNSVLASVMYFCTPCSIPPYMYKETLKKRNKRDLLIPKGRESSRGTTLVDHIHMYRILFIFLTREYTPTLTLFVQRGNSRVIFPLSPYPELSHHPQFAI